MSRSTTQDDIEIGQLLKLARKKAKLSQTEVGQAVGVTYQQIQKYENGTDRIAVSRLLQMARAMGVDPVSLLPLDEGEGQERGLDDFSIRALAILSRIKTPAMKDAALSALEALAVAAGDLERGKPDAGKDDAPGRRGRRRAA